MKLLDRYIAKQIFVTAFFAVGVLSLVLVFGNVFKQLLDLLVNHDVPLEYILSFMAYILPFSLTFTIPWGFLTAVLLVFGRLSAENELIALRSMGVSITRICYSLLGLAIICVGICLWINVDVAPKAQQKMKAALYNIATSNPIAMFGSDQIIDEFPGRKIYVSRKEGTQLFDVLMYDLSERGEPLSVVHAREGTLQTDLSNAQNPQILLELKNARYEQHDSAEPRNLAKIRQGITAERIVLPISLKDLYERNKVRRGLTQMTLTELVSETGKSQRPATKEDIEQLSAAKTEVNKRFSFSLASFAFALIGVPLAITAQRKETSVGFLFSLVVAFVYFFFIILANAVRENPKFHPELLIWAPNVLFISLGTYMFWRLSRR